MKKINGYPKEEAEQLVRWISEGKNKGKTLTEQILNLELKSL